MATTARLHSLDAARATLLLLGIPFHASEIYRISGGFGVDSPQSSFAATTVTALIHSFRMPAFFLLSGFFAAMLVSRDGALPWFRNRLVRLGIPLVATAISFGILEVALKVHYASGTPLLEAVRLAAIASPTEWINHRWFLVVLLLYCATIALAHPLLRHAPAADAHFTSNRGPVWLVGIVVLLTVPFIAIAAGKFGGEWLIESAAVKGYAISYIKYLPYFLIGALCFAAPGGLARFASVTRSDAVMACLFLTVYLATYFAYYSPETYAPSAGLETTFKLVRIAVETATGFYVTKLFLAGMTAIAKSANRIVAYFVDASLCIYLVHEVFVISTGGAFLDVNLWPMVEVGIICATTLAGSLLIYEAARHNRLASYCLNGGPFALCRTSNKTAVSTVMCSPPPA